METQCDSNGGSTCRRCGHAGCDLRLIGCGCTLHARCIPLSFIIASPSGNEPYSYSAIPEPAPSKCQTCRFCQTSVVEGIQLFPVSFSGLERAIELRKEQARAASQKSQSKESVSCGQKRARELSFDGEDSILNQIQAESSYLLLSHTAAANGHGDKHTYRTGRWTSEEMAFVDQLVNAFDQGIIALPHGVKLNEFLGDMLLCKSSRLTKKMKNAKLSTRSYTIPCTPLTLGGSDQFCATLSALQERFLQSVVSEATQLELRFNMSKLWRTHFSNLCLQVGYDALDAQDWLSSLEEMEQRASDAQDTIRKARRRRMGLALRKDVGEKPMPGLFIGGMEAKDASLILSGGLSSGNEAPAPVVSSVVSSGSTSAADNAQLSQGKVDVDFLSDFLELSTSGGEGVSGRRSRLNSEDISFAFDDLVDPLNMVSGAGDPLSSLEDCGPFVQQIVSFLKTEKLPFEHADIWVPSYMPSDKPLENKGDKEELRLFHAGHATKTNVDSVTALQLNEYGIYSTNFCFSPGVGLPGRVYQSGQPSWENSIDEADPKRFERAGGAKVYGVKTALGIPVDCPDVGRVIISIYSTSDVTEDPVVVKKCCDAFSKWIPEPKWKLVIEMGSSNGTEEASTLPVPMPTSSFVNKSPVMSSVAPVSSNGTLDKSRSASVSSLDEVRRLTPSNIRMTTITTPSGTLVCHDHNKQNDAGGTGTEVEGPFSNPSICGASVASMSPQSQPVPSPKLESNSANSIEVEEVENRIVTLLGDHMPATSSSSSDSELVPYFMSLRLLLLGTAARRSAQEVEALNVLKKSFQGYSKDNRRSGAELASLIAKDWMYLTSRSGVEAETLPQHQSHVMSLPNLQMAQSTSPVLSHAPVRANSGPDVMAHPVSFSSLVSFEGSRGDNARSDSLSTTHSSQLSPGQNRTALLNVVPES